MFHSRTLPTSSIIAVLHLEHSANLHFTSTTSEALRTIRIRTNNTKESHIVPILHNQRHRRHQKPLRLGVIFASTIHLLLFNAPRQNTKRITHSPFYNQSDCTSGPIVCSHDALLTMLPAASYLFKINALSTSTVPTASTHMPTAVSIQLIQQRIHTHRSPRRQYRYSPRENSIRQIQHPLSTRNVNCTVCLSEFYRFLSFCD